VSETRPSNLESWILSVGAGATLDAVAAFAEREGLAGAEFLAGIPGTVGAGFTPMLVLSGGRWATSFPVSPYSTRRAMSRCSRVCNFVASIGGG